jgi:Fe-S-cluster containining protein
LEEVKGAAKIMNLTFKKFCKEYLIQEWWAGKEHISIPTPRRNFAKFEYDNLVKQNGKGFVKATFAHNFVTGYACVFLDDNNCCKIHTSKPLECKDVFGCQSNQNNRKQIVKYWEKHQRELPK